MKKGFLDGYKTYDTSGGFGSSREWKKTFQQRMTGEEAKAIIDSQPSSPHEILGVSKTASRAVIKAAFRKRIMEWHPDKNPHRLNEAEERSKKIIAAYSLLS
jgi:DnaJ-class molecular chaperone